MKKNLSKASTTKLAHEGNKDACVNKSVEFTGKGTVTGNGMVVTIPGTDLRLDEVMPELFERYEDQLIWDERKGMECISVTGLCHLYPDGSNAFKLFTPEEEERIMGPTTRGERVVPKRSTVAVRALRSRSAFGLVREGADDFTLHVRVPKAVLEALGVSVELFFEAEVEKLLTQMAVDDDYSLPAPPPRIKKPAACRRDSRGRFVKA